MARSICIVSQKGGVGKTTVSLNLAVALAERGRRTLLVDLDPQGAIGHSLARSEGDLAGLAEILAGTLTPHEALLATKLETLTLLPRGRLDPADAWEYERLLVETSMLKDALQALEKDFDILLVDTSSGVGHVAWAALSVCGFALVPIQAESLSFRTVSQILRLMEKVREERNPALELLGILPTMLEKGRSSSFGVLGDIWSGLEGVLETVIPRADIYADASRRGLPVAFMGGIVSAEARRFDILAGEVETLLSRRGLEEAPHEQRAERLLL